MQKLSKTAHSLHTKKPVTFYNFVLEAPPIFLQHPPSFPCISPISAFSSSNPAIHFIKAFSQTPCLADDQDGVVTLYNSSAIVDTKKKNPFPLKVGMIQMLRGGAIFEVTSAKQARIAEDAGACSILVSEELSGRGISRMPDPSLITEIKGMVSIPIIVRTRVGHFVEAHVLEAVGVDYIDESEALAPADEDHFINKHNFMTPFVSGCRGLGEALKRVRERAAMIRTQGDLSGSGSDIAGTARSVRSLMGHIRVVNNMDEDKVFAFSKKISVPFDLVAQTKQMQMGRLPVVHFAATAADAALMMQLGCDGVLLSQDVFKSSDP